MLLTVGAHSDVSVLIFVTVCASCKVAADQYAVDTVKPVFFACPLFREFCEPGKFAKITGRENLNTVAFQCSKKRQN